MLFSEFWGEKSRCITKSVVKTTTWTQTIELKEIRFIIQVEKRVS